MKFDASVYDKEFYKSLEQYDPFLETALLAIFSYFTVPESMIDFGCGTGRTLDVARKLEVWKRVGVEIFDHWGLGRYLATPIVIHDLRDPLDLDYQFELVICWEVAEHLPEESADTLCTTLAKHTKDVLVFTAATTDQDGYHHLNPQPHTYWINKLQEAGLKYLLQDTARLKDLWRYTTGPCHWLPDNVLVFRTIGR